MSSDIQSEIARRRAEILDAVATAARKTGRSVDDVTLMAVTKTHSAEVVRAAARAGLTRFGENRVQEGAPKAEALRTEFPGLEWRLIGPLQTNKAKTALQWFQVVETVDRERLAQRLESLTKSTDGFELAETDLKLRACLDPRPTMRFSTTTSAVTTEKRIGRVVWRAG